MYVRAYIYILYVSWSGVCFLKMFGASSPNHTARYLHMLVSLLIVAVGRNIQRSPLSRIIYVRRIDWHIIVFAGPTDMLSGGARGARNI